MIVGAGGKGKGWVLGLLGLGCWRVEWGGIGYSCFTFWRLCHGEEKESIVEYFARRKREQDELFIEAQKTAIGGDLRHV